MGAPTEDLHEHHGRDDIVRSQVAQASVALAITSILLVPVNVVLRPFERYPEVAMVEATTALLLAALALVVRWRGFPRGAAHLAAITLYGILLGAASGVIVLAHDLHATSYAALLMILASFLVLSWRWYLVELAMMGAMLGTLVAAGIPLGGFEGVTLIGSSFVVSAVVLASRRRTQGSIESAFERVRAARADALTAGARLRAVFDRSPTGLLLASFPDGRIERVNPAAARILGYEAAEMVGRTPMELLGEGHDGPHAAAFGRLTSTWGAVERDIPYRRRDGRRIVMHMKGIAGRNDEGEPAWFLALFEDVSEARAVEAQLRLQSQALQAIAQAVIVTDPARRIIVWNGAAERIYGWRAADVIGRNLAEVSPETMAAGAMAAPSASSPSDAAGRTWEAEATLRRKDGTTFVAHVSEAPFLDASGKLAGFIGVSEDVTERRKTEGALHRAERDSALGTLVAGVAHEINNPLQFMGGHLDLLEMDIRSVAQRPGMGLEERAELSQIEGEVAVIRRGLDQVAHVTRALRQVARRTDAPRRSEVVAPLIEAVLATARPRMGPNVELRVDVPEDVVVFASADAVVQVVLNLVLNAAEAMGNRGVLSIRAKAVGDDAWIEVEDDGKGIPPEAASKMFTPFFTTKQEGTGLGLSISRRIAHDHGGDLTFESRPGRTVFKLTLPSEEVVGARVAPGGVPS